MYIIEGSITIAIGILVLFIMPDDYQSAWILDDREKFLMRVRDIQSREYMGDMSWSWVEVKKALTEPVVWLSGFSQLVSTVRNWVEREVLVHSLIRCAGVRRMPVWLLDVPGRDHPTVRLWHDRKSASHRACVLP